MLVAGTIRPYVRHDASETGFSRPRDGSRSMKDILGQARETKIHGRWRRGGRPDQKKRFLCAFSATATLVCV